jgi:hypothetical protein
VPYILLSILLDYRDTTQICIHNRSMWLCCTSITRPLTNKLKRLTLIRCKMLFGRSGRPFQVLRRQMPTSNNILTPEPSNSTSQKLLPPIRPVLRLPRHHLEFLYHIIRNSLSPMQFFAQLGFFLSCQLVLFLRDTSVLSPRCGSRHI